MPTVASGATRRRAGAPLAYVPALDGLRAVAVLAVMAYHSGLGFLPGGFLGVDLFFTLSGYLITTLLIREWERTGRIDLRAFWARRARRLLPALAVVLVLVAAYATFVADPVVLDRIRGDGLASLGYVANWRFILSHQSYFESFSAPSPLRHMWSLAIEEQWYLIWPGLVALGLSRWRGRNRPMVAAIAVATVASVAAMAALYSPYGDPSRAYYGTDTRAHTLLVGALLAFLLRHRTGTERGRPARCWRFAARAAGLGAGAGLLAAFFAVHDTDAVLYRGGLLLFAVGAALVITAAIDPGPSIVKAVLSPAPLRAIGRISYGLYLWHWPVNVWLVPDRTGLDGVALAGLRTVVAFAGAIASSMLVERPVRFGQVRLPRPAMLTATAVVASVALLVGATGGPGTVADPLASAAGRDSPPTGSTLVPTTAPTTSAPPSAEGLPTGPIITARQPDSPVAVAASPTGPPVEALMVGDSVGYTLTSEMPPIQGLHVRTRALLGCGSMDGDSYTGVATHSHEGCEDRFDSWRQALQAPTDVVLIAVGAWEVYDRVLDGRRIPFGSAEHRRLMREGFQRDVDVLRDAGATRIAFLDVPCFREAADSLGGPASARNDASRVAGVNAAITDVMKANPDLVAIIDIAAFACPGGLFRESVDGVELRPDGVHYSGGPSRLAAWSWLAPVVLQLAARPSL